MADICELDPVQNRDGHIYIGSWKLGKRYK